jgi:hypothetical protein
VYGNPLRYIDPSGHDPRCGPDGIFCGNGDWVNPQYPSRGYLLGPLWNNNSGSASSGGGGNSNSGSSGGEIVSLLPEGPACTVNYCGQPNNLPDPSHGGYSNPDLDAIYFFWEKFVTPMNDIIKIDDIYRISSRGGWKAARYSLNLGPIEAIVQGSRQAYRDSWYQTLTPTQRLLRPLVVGTEAYITDIVAGRVGEGFRNAGFLAGGPPGAAGGYLAGNTYTTVIMDRLWMEYVNPTIFSELGVWP